MAAEQSLASLIVSETKAAILQKLLDFCTAFGLDVESWQSGDPTRSVLDANASRWAEFENLDTGFPTMIKGVLLGLSSGGWLTELLKRRYNVFRREATFATVTIQITNTTPQDFGNLDPDDVTVRNSVTATKPQFRNSEAFSLGPNEVVSVKFEAEIAGTGGNSEVGDVDELISGLGNGVTVTNTSTATGQDEENDDDATSRGQAKLESLSPAGPRGAYEYMLKTPEFQSDGQTNVTRVRVVEDSDYGDAVIFIAGASGALLAADRDKGEETIENWSNPFCVNDVLLLASNNQQPITYQLWVYDSINMQTTDIQTKVSNYLQEQIKTRPIGGDDAVLPSTNGVIYREWIRAQILQAVAPHGYRCNLILPAADIPITLQVNFLVPTASTAQVATLGAIASTITQIPRVSG